MKNTQLPDLFKGVLSSNIWETNAKMEYLVKTSFFMKLDLQKNPLME